MTADYATIWRRNAQMSVVDLEDKENLGPWEWMTLSERGTGLPFPIMVCDVAPIVIPLRVAEFDRAGMNEMYKWIALNADALLAHQSGKVSSIGLLGRLKRLE